jgi:AcrR family transcriptional regulator
VRSDAVRNRERVLEAARSVFAERGLDACVDEVATRAGVGKATVYRSFPTKDHLVAAIAVQRMRWLQERAEAVAERDAGFAGLERLLVAAAEAHAGDRVLAAAMAATPEIPELAEARAAVRAALQRVLDGARRAGEVRRDATADDIRVLFAGVSRVLHEGGVDDPAVWRRYARLVAAALRP